MKIAILGGTGALGSALACRFAAAGDEVRIGSREPAKAEGFAAGLAQRFPRGRFGGSGLADAAAWAETCFLTVPYSAHAVTIALVREASQGKIFIDATAPLRPPAVGRVQLPEAGCAAVEAQHALGPGVKVVSALQDIAAEKLASGEVIDGDVLVASDDATAAATVCDLLSRIGLRTWHVGPLANSAAAEALTSVLIQINRRYKLAHAGIRITGGPKGPRGLTVTPAPGLPVFSPGDDLAAHIGESLVSAGLRLEANDVLVVAQKVVSKVEGRFAKLAAVAVGPAARVVAEKAGKVPEVVELIQSESQELMRVVPGVVIARHRSGQVLANAGIDASNVGPGDGESVLLWPLDANKSAEVLRLSLEARFGVPLAVIVSDSIGRAWRMGTTGTAIGVSGLRPLRDRRGEVDLFGRELKATIVGVADEIAAAASLVIGEAAEGTPVAVVRGAVYERDETATIADLVRPIAEDLFT